jgi:putative SOS response-associated peptidase YedK
MCYFNGIKVLKNEIVSLKELHKPVTEANFLVRPLQSGFLFSGYPVLKPKNCEKDFDIVEMEWGFIPGWIKNRTEATKMRTGGINPNTGKFEQPLLTLNAIGEEIVKKPMFKNAAKKRRCLVLSSGFYEWRHVYGRNKRTGEPLKTAVKYPHYIYLPGQTYFYMAGIWQAWTDQQTGETVDTFAICTTSANKLMELIHNTKKRMPTILGEEEAYRWMFDDLSDEEITELASSQVSTEKMTAHAIAKDFQDAADPTTPFAYAALLENDGLADNTAGTPTLF